MLVARSMILAKRAIKGDASMAVSGMAHSLRCYYKAGCSLRSHE